MDQGEVFRKYLPRPLQGVLLCGVRGMHFVAHQMLSSKGKLEGGDFWIREGISENISLVIVRGFALRAALNAVCCAPNAVW